MYKKQVLDNGLKLVSCHMPQRQSAALGIWLKAGGRFEGEKNKGIFHFLEHLLFKGSKKYSCRRIKESIEGIGGALNGFTSEELTCYLVKIPSAYFDLALDILSDMVLNPLLAEEEIAKERTVILEEIKMYRDLPQSHVHEILDELLWPAQPLGMSIAGTMESVSGIARQDLTGAKEGYYTASNIIISAAGALQHDTLLERAKKIFSGCQRTQENHFSPVQEKQQQPQSRIMDKATEQTHLALGFNHCLNRQHPLKYALGLLHIIMGANMSSRLFDEVREKRGLAYEIGTQVRLFQDTGAFVVRAGIDNRKVNQTIEVILKELERIKMQPAGEDELKRAKEFYLGQLMLSLEDSQDQMLWIGESVASLDRTYTPEEIVEEVNKVTLDDIREVARQVFRQESLNLAAIGPLAGQEESIHKNLRIAA